MAFSVDQNDVYHSATDHDMDFTVTSDGSTPVDITGATPINWEIRTHPLNATTVLKKTGSIQDATNGVFRVTLATTDTPAIGVYFMQVDMTLSGAETIVAEGSFEVKPKITD